jgi:hypothetical protein
MSGSSIEAASSETATPGIVEKEKFRKVDTGF